VKVNGAPERWLVAARLSRMSKKDRERGDDVITGVQTQDRWSTDWARQEGHVIVHVTRDRNISGAVALLDPVARAAGRHGELALLVWQAPVQPLDKGRSDKHLRLNGVLAELAHRRRETVKPVV
jgi:hypothetical protein